MENIKRLASKMSIFLKKFDPDSMDFLIWLDHFEYLVDILEIPYNIRACVLLHMIIYNPLYYSEIRLPPETIERSLYNKLISFLINAYSIYEGQFADRYRFDNRHQFPCESARHYADVLTKLIAKCDLDHDITSLLLDRFIMGLRSDLAKKKLVQMRQLTLDTAINLAENFDSIEKIYNEARKIADECYKNLK